MKFSTERPVGGKGLQDGARVREPTGLDQDAPELRQLALVALGDEAAQRDLQIGAGVAAEATVAEERDLIGAGAQQRVVDTDTAELVDHDRRAFAFRRLQKAPHQGGLSRAEEAADDGNRDARAARSLEPASELASGRGGENIEQRVSRAM